MSYPSGNWVRPQILASKLIFFVAYANFGIAFGLTERVRAWRTPECASAAACSGARLGALGRSMGGVCAPVFFDMSMYVFMFMLWFSQMHAMLARSRGVFKKLARCWHARTLGSVSVARKVIATVSIRGAVRRLSATWDLHLSYIFQCIFD